MVNPPISIPYSFNFASQLLALLPLARCPSLVGEPYSALSTRQAILILHKSSGFSARSFVTPESPGECTSMKFIEFTLYSNPLSAPLAQPLVSEPYSALSTRQAILILHKSSGFSARSFVSTIFRPFYLTGYSYGFV